MSVSTVPELPTALVAEAMSLTAVQKLFLADRLISAAEPGDDPALVRAEWTEVIKDRIAGYLSGKYRTVDALSSVDESLAQLPQDFSHRGL
jgi:hypothetical protein